MFLQQGPGMYPARMNRNRHPFRLGAPRHPFPHRSVPAARTNSLTNIADKGITGLSKTLTNVQQILNVVQTTAPIIQEYGPMVKNLPAMYRMMKAFKEIQAMDGGEEEEKKEKAEHKVKETEQTTSRQRTGVSKPKLFI
ncbi:hypothetical protein GCM10010978_17600 [Compostibacillus humi]|uniref:YqfQ-like protein n=1 Tax=Compostibacillus humi TaxID=1245525 RepID=A0A8J2X8U9_9BACI|nr:VrrA/YqfQ family protein [Compostibacillus humi]GFZ76371.1 hypothetical protein GCM10010978_17600 [Compostibacillus humi]HLT57023.1 VrrA/YqfQ family protein [Bacillota bacterium]